jgi:hypothetical protein
MRNLTYVRLVPPSTAQSRNPQAGVRAVPLSPSSTAQSRPTGDNFGDKRAARGGALSGQVRRVALGAHKAQVHAVLAKEGIAAPVSDVFGKGGWALLNGLKRGAADPLFRSAQPLAAFFPRCPIDCVVSPDRCRPRSRSRHGGSTRPRCSVRFPPPNRAVPKPARSIRRPRSPRSRSASS